MNTTNTTQDYSYLPVEGQQAQKNGTTWEYEPETAEAGTEVAQWCESCTRYHQIWLVPGYRVEASHVFTTLWVVDTDGDWSRESECDMDYDDYQAWYDSNLSAEIVDASWRGYYVEVARSGDDYLGVFNIKRTRPATFKVFLTGSLGCVYFRKARDRAGTGTSYTHLNWKRWPQSLKDYFMLEDVSGIGVGPFRIADETIKSLSDVRTLAGDTIKWTSRTKYPNVMANGLITLDVPLADMYVNAEIKRAARAALKEGTDETANIGC